MTRTHVARYLQLQRKRSQVKRRHPPTAMDIPGIHRASKMTLLLHHEPLGGSPGQHRRRRLKSERNPPQCLLLIHTELAIGRLRHPRQPHLIGEPMAWTKKNLQWVFFCWYFCILDPYKGLFIIVIMILYWRSNSNCVDGRPCWCLAPKELACWHQLAKRHSPNQLFCFLNYGVGWNEMCNYTHTWYLSFFLHRHYFWLKFSPHNSA